MIMTLPTKISCAPGRVPGCHRNTVSIPARTQAPRSGARRASGCRFALADGKQPTDSAGEGEGKGKTQNYRLPDGKFPRRKGRPEWKRSPDDTPLRDGNRDRLMGMLTTQSVKTLIYYTMETNQQLHHWINKFYQQHQIPVQGNWDDVSGETFLRTLLSMRVEEAGHPSPDMDPMYDCTVPIGVDPRSIANRILDIRKVLAKEFSDDLAMVAEENSLLLKETLQASLEVSLKKAQAAEDEEKQASEEIRMQLQAEWDARVERLSVDMDKPSMDKKDSVDVDDSASNSGSQ